MRIRPLGLVSLALVLSLHSLQAFAHAPIIHGTAVASKSWIAQTVVALIGQSSQGQSLCTASVVASDLAVTAAHCVTEEGTRLPIPVTLIFAVDIEKAASADFRAVDAVDFPASWNPNGTKNTGDVALVHFNGGLPAGYSPSDLLPFDQLLKKDARVEIAGYGITDAHQNTGDGKLRHTTIRLLNPDYSQTEVQLDQSQGGGACHGDSGGPAYLVIQGNPYLFGITSRGAGDCDVDVIYTRIEPYRDWFEKAAKALRS